MGDDRQREAERDQQQEQRPRKRALAQQPALEPDFGPPRMLVMEADAASGEVRELAAVNGAISRLSASPDDSRLAFIGSLTGPRVRSYDQPDLFVLDRASLALRNLTEKYDYDISGGLTGARRCQSGGGQTDQNGDDSRHAGMARPGRAAPV